MLSGIGNRSLPKKSDQSNWLGWVELIKKSSAFELVAAHDISQEGLTRIMERGYLKENQTFRDFSSMLQNVKADCILIANPMECHHESIKAALQANLHILVEKPFVQSLTDGEELLSLIPSKKRVVSVVQNWRTKDVAQILRKAIKSGALGKVGHIFFRYIRNRENPQYPKYIFEEPYPLLYAMGIHHLDLMRYILDDEFITVQGNSFRPSWSLYQSDTGLNLYLETKKGTSVVYTGTISSMSKGVIQESLVVEGEKGTFVNESEWSEPPLWFYPRTGGIKIDLTSDIREKSVAEQYNKSDVLILANFYQSILGAEKPICTAQDAFESIRVLEASRKACETGERINMETFHNMGRIGISV